MLLLPLLRLLQASRPQPATAVLTDVALAAAAPGCHAHNHVAVAE
jgi:hypothetical protein